MAAAHEKRTQQWPGSHPCGQSGHCCEATGTVVSIAVKAAVHSMALQAWPGSLRARVCAQCQPRPDVAPLVRPRVVSGLSGLPHPATTSQYASEPCRLGRQPIQQPSRPAPRHVIAQAAAGAGGLPSTSPPQYNPFLRVVLPTALTLLLCNMDRICLSVAIIPMSAEFGWPASLQGVIQSAFLWGYMATQLLGGTLADKYGGKWVMAAGIAWFSIASLILPVALSPEIAAAGMSVAALLVARCAVGLGEGIALPTMNNLVANHIPESSKTKALGMCFTGFHSGNLVGLILSPLLLVNFGWRALFYVFGILGAPLLALWIACVPDKAPPRLQATDSSTPGGGQASKPPTPVSAVQLLSKTATWAIVIVNIVNHWGFFIYLNWMPTYFAKALGFDLRSSSFMSFLPWLVMALGSSLSGVLVDHLIARGHKVITVRKAVQAVAFMVPAVALVALSQPGVSPQAAVALMTVALGTTSLGQAGFVANMSDIAPRHAGKMFGLCNTFGSLSGIVGVTAVGFIVEATKSFSPVFLITAGFYVVGTAVWLLLAQGERIFD